MKFSVQFLPFPSAGLLILPSTHPTPCPLSNCSSSSLSFPPQFVATPILLVLGLKTSVILDLFLFPYSTSNQLVGNPGSFAFKIEPKSEPLQFLPCFRPCTNYLLLTAGALPVSLLLPSTLPSLFATQCQSHPLESRIMSLFYPEPSKRFPCHWVKAKVIQMPHQALCDPSPPDTPALALASMLPAWWAFSELPYLPFQLLTLINCSPLCFIFFCKLITNLCAYIHTVGAQCKSLSSLGKPSLATLSEAISPLMTMHPITVLFFL